MSVISDNLIQMTIEKVRGLESGCEFQLNQLFLHNEIEKKNMLQLGKIFRKKVENELVGEIDILRKTSDNHLVYKKK